MRRLLFVAVLTMGFYAPALAAQVSVAVSARDDIYLAAGNDVAGDTGQPPIGIQVQGGEILGFSATGKVSLDIGSGDAYNDADGAGAIVGQSSNDGAGSIAGLTAPGAGYVTGVFVGPGVPSGPPPQALNFLAPGGTAFLDLSPQLNQVFFIGDGLTGDGTGAVQRFHAPPGAQALYLGISDAGDYNGAPGWYHDNSGIFQVTVTTLEAPDVTAAATPCPTPPMLEIYGPWRGWAAVIVAIAAALLLMAMVYFTLRPAALPRWRLPGRGQAARRNGVLVCRLIFALASMRKDAAAQAKDADDKILRLIQQLSNWGTAGATDTEILTRLKACAADDPTTGWLVARALASAEARKTS